MRKHLAILLFCIPLAAWGQLSQAQESAIEQAAVAGITSSRIPALSVAVVSGDGPVWAKAWGFSDMENHVPATPRTVFRLASISKTFTAVAAMSLVERGQLDLDAEVQQYVSFPRKKWPITTRQLLSHQSGIRHYKGADFNSTQHYGGVMEALAIFASDPLEHQPGTKYLYSSYGFNLAGAVVERVARKSFVEYVREAVLVPLDAFFLKLGPAGLTAVVRVGQAGAVGRRVRLRIAEQAAKGRRGSVSVFMITDVCRAVLGEHAMGSILQ
jgi:CubicO group peptidase (beta-lactamase class C family)